MKREQIIIELDKRQKEKALKDHIREQCKGKKLKECPDILFSNETRSLFFDTHQFNCSEEVKAALLSEPPLLFVNTDIERFLLEIYFEELFPNVSLHNYMNFGYDSELVL